MSIVEIGTDQEYPCLPGGEWKVEVGDPRLLLAVVYELEEMLKINYVYDGKGDKFIAEWKDGGVRLTVPKIDGNVNQYLFVLAEMLKTMAKVVLDLDFGTRILAGSRIMKPESGIVVPGIKVAG